MASFFEKLKKGMGIEAPIEEEIKEEVEEKTEKKVKIPKRTRVIKKMVKEQPASVIQIKKLELKAEEFKNQKEESGPPIESPEKEESEIKETIPIKTTEVKEKWSTFNQESVGQLAVDIYQTTNDLVIQSAIAGVKPESLDILMEKDIITIKGIRERPFEENGDYFTQECYWGPFSREVILPAEVDPNKVTAEMKDGILTIRIPKILREKQRKIVVRNI